MSARPPRRSWTSWTPPTGIPGQTAGRVAHWVKGNAAERVPHRWIVADSEAYREQVPWGELQSLRCVVGHAWRDDLKSGEVDEWLYDTDSARFWEWATDWCSPKGRTVLWFHNAGYDLRTLDAFQTLPGLGYELDWCNLDSSVSVCTWRGPNGTLVIADTWTWTNKGLESLGKAAGIAKPRLPRNDDSIKAWLTRCEADVRITEVVVRDLVRMVRDWHLGNWQPSGAGMGFSTWRHKFMTDKILVHDDESALMGEREAMHAGRAEAWYHGDAIGGPFTEWDMHMSYPTIAADCEIPAKLWSHEVNPTKAQYTLSRKHFGVLARVRVHVDVPCVPARVDDRVIWPTGEFITTLWDCELDLISANGGTYKVLEQWRYVMKPALKAWADWSIRTCALSDDFITPVQRIYVKHQSRATIGRFALRHANWEQWADNPGGWCGISNLIDVDSGENSRLMHVGNRIFRETAKHEGDSSTPQVPSFIMAMARVRLWRAIVAAGPLNVLHMDTDSLITNAEGSRRLRAAIREGLEGEWKPKTTFRHIRVIGPRHYRTPDRKVIPGVPLSASEIAPGEFRGEVWESLASSLAEGVADKVRIKERTWSPKRVDYRRPWTAGDNHYANPIKVGINDDGINYVPVDEVG